MAFHQESRSTWQNSRNNTAANQLTNAVIACHEQMVCAYSTNFNGKINTTREFTTPLGVSTIKVPQEDVVLATVFRAGLPLHQGFHNYFDHCENAFVSAYRKYLDEVNFDIHIEYLASPELEGKTLILVDPMLATGGSMHLAYEALLTKGTPERLFVCSVIASREALEYLEERLPEDTILYVAAVDEFLDPAFVKDAEADH